MLSYVIPVEGKSPSVVNNNRLESEVEAEKRIQQKNNTSNNALTNTQKIKMAPTAIHNFANVGQQTQQSAIANGGNKKIMKNHVKSNNYSGPAAISTESSASSLSSNASHHGDAGSQLKPKLAQNGAVKTTSLKRVSFGSSKGSMVETLIFESPLQEESEVTSLNVEEVPPSFLSEGERSGSDSKKVRVTFFESERPLVVNSPEPGDFIFDTLDASNVMTSVSVNGTQTPQYQRQASVDSGWDNPFRPDGDLSREADEIVGLIKEGKPITPTSINGEAKTIVDEFDSVQNPTRKSQLSSLPTQTPTPKKETNGKTAKTADKTGGVVEVQRTIVSPSSGVEVEPVVIKKKAKCKCCVVQ